MKSSNSVTPKSSKVVTVASSKGGTGKTTLSFLLAMRAAKDKQRVLAIDHDEQGTLREAFAMHESLPFDLLSLSHKDMQKLPAVLKQYREKYDLIIIDTSPRDNESNNVVIKESNLVLITVRPSQADYWSIENTVSKVEGRAAGFVISQAITSTNLAKNFPNDLQEGYGLPVYGVLSMRASYSTIFENPAQCLKTMKVEIDKLYKVVKSELQN